MSRINYKLLFPTQILFIAFSFYLTKPVVPLPRNPPTSRACIFRKGWTPYLAPKGESCLGKSQKAQIPCQ